MGNQARIPRARKRLHLLFTLGVTFVSIENASTYLSLTMRKDIVEVSTAAIFIGLFGLELGILTAFLIVFSLLLLFYRSALVYLPRRNENPRSRNTFLLSFVALSGLCFGLLPSALNDASSLIFGYAPLGWLDPVSRFLFLDAIVALGAVSALLVERKLPKTDFHAYL